MAGIFTVSQVTGYIKNMFVQDYALSRIQVRGEVSNCKYHTSGHIYFTLKDEGAQIAAVMFAGARRGLSFKLAEGMQVVVSGTVDVYERDGRYQLYAKTIVREGRGDLYACFEKLRDELKEMGMFDARYKQPLPRYARRIGIVTAPTGAAIQDIINISRRRNPYIQLVLYPALVQGEQAPASIARGIEVLDAMGLDVLIVGRGGGSIEDLWAFNEEITARAIFDCTTPIISAVGHETDVTIADYVADLRAPTPSAAAELAVFDYALFKGQCAQYAELLDRSMARHVERARFRLSGYRMQLRVHDPTRVVNAKRQRLADIEEELKRHLNRRISDAQRRLSGDDERLGRAMQDALTCAKNRLAMDCARLEALSPLKKLSGGFGFIEDSQGRAVRTARQVPPGERIRVYVQDGVIKARVEEFSVAGGFPP